MRDHLKDSETHGRRTLFENIASLAVLQGANYILPLLVLPYLVRVLGPARFGLLAFAQAFMQYFILLSDYGFNLSATQEVVRHRDDPERLSGTFNSVFAAKLLLLALSFLGAGAIVLLVPKFRADWPLYCVSFLAVVGSVLFPVWFFQGMEKMKYITGLNVTTRVLVTLAIFLLVRTPDDLLVAAGIQAGGVTLAGLLSLFWIRSVAPVRFGIPTLSAVVASLRDGWHLFISSAAISLYTTSNLFLLGLLGNNVAVGYFSAAEKLIRAVNGALTPVTQAIYPHVNALISRSRETGLHFLRRSLRWIGGGALAVSVLLMASAGVVVRVLFGPEFLPAVAVVRWMAFLPFLVALSNIFGVQTMLSMGLRREFTKIVVMSGVLNVLLLVLLIPAYGAVGTAGAVLCSELLVTIAMGGVLYRNDIHLFVVRREVAV
jgi:PST family polysaccharide transporter